MKQNQSTKKLLLIAISAIVLISNISPIFAQTIELQILGAGYRITGPDTVVLPTINTSTNNQYGEIAFRDLNNVEPAQSNNFLKISDENGGNPFDVIVTGTRLTKTSVNTTTTSGSSGNNIKVVNTNGFTVGDIISIEGFYRVFKVTEITDATTIVITPTPTIDPIAGKTVQTSYQTQNRNCMYFSKACFPLQNLQIKNIDNDGVGFNDLITINGIESDFQLSQNNYYSFGANTTTIEGSTADQLKVVNSNDFQVGDQITLLNPNYDFTTPGCDQIPCPVSPTTTYTIINIVDGETIEVDTPPVPLDGTVAGLTVITPDSRAISVGRGNGQAPGEWSISPSLQINVPAGQNPGNYTSYLTFTIV